MTRKLTQAEWADLSAWIDGELPAEQAGRIESLVASDDAWACALAELRAIDEALDAAPAPKAADDLSHRILEFVDDNTLTHEDLADLSAWMDGELDEAHAARVARHVVTDPAWRRAHEELRQVDDAMDALTVPPCPSELPGRIVARTTGGSFDWEHLRRTLLSAPAAVAAMVVVLLAIYVLTTVWSGPQGIAPAGLNNQAQVKPNPSSDTETQTVRDVVEEELAGYDRVEQFAIMNREMIENYAVIENLDVLREMERIETEGDS